MILYHSVAQTQRGTDPLFLDLGLQILQQLTEGLLLVSCMCYKTYLSELATLDALSGIYSTKRG